MNQDANTGGAATGDEALALALEALELADSVMRYCGGDAWEREVTADDRARFAEIYERFFPRPVADETLPIWPTKAQVRAMYGQVECPNCARRISGAPGSLKQHIKAVHADTMLAARGNR